MDIPVLTQHYAMLKRNLLYTGDTRGKRLVVVLGRKNAVAIAVRNASGRRRWTNGCPSRCTVRIADRSRWTVSPRAGVDRHNALRVIG